MKKINYEIVGRFENGSKYGVMSKKTVEGQQIDEYAAVRKSGKEWTVDSYKTGIAIATGANTRKSAVEKYENMKEAVVKILEDEDKMKKMMEQKAKAVPETELAKYEEKNITVLQDWRIDKIQHEAKKTGCIVKQDGEHVKIYGTAEMLQGVNELLKKWKENEMQENTKDTKPDKIDVSKLNADNLKEYLPSLLMSLANDKHNSSIILAAGIEAGAINPEALLEYFQTGRMPAVHTFDVWKKAGYSVRKGEKHAFEARIWKYTEKKTGTYTEEEAAAINAMVVNADGSKIEAGDEKISRDFIKKTAYFFTFAQVEKAPELQPLPELPEDVKQERRGGCCWISGNTYAIKDALKAAGFRWSKKNGAWYRREAA
jgi:hypothetical protein